MASRHDTMMNPPIEELLERGPGSKFTLVTLGAKRARQINSYYNQLSEGLGTVVPPAGPVVGPQAAVDRLRGDRRRQDPRLLAGSRGRGRRDAAEDTEPAE